MRLYLVYTMVQKSQKWPKTQVKGGPALSFRKASAWRSMLSANCSDISYISDIRCPNLCETDYKILSHLSHWV